MPELALMTENYDYEVTRMILVAGFWMRQIYDHNMQKEGKVESLEKISKKFNVSKTHLFEMLKGKKLKRGESLKEAELFLDTEEDIKVLG